MKFKTIWDEFVNYQSLPACTGGACQAQMAAQHKQHVMHFLMGLSETYAYVRGQILLSDPIPNINKTYSMVLQEEKQKAKWLE